MMNTEIYEHLTLQELYVIKENISSQALFYFLFWHCILLLSLNKNKINLKGQILISDVTRHVFFWWKKDMWQFMLCIWDHNLALSLQYWWVSIWTSINVNSTSNNAYQRKLMQHQSLSLFTFSIKLFPL